MPNTPGAGRWGRRGWGERERGGEGRRRRKGERGRGGEGGRESGPELEGLERHTLQIRLWNVGVKNHSPVQGDAVKYLFT